MFFAFFSDFGNLTFKMSDTDNSATLDFYPKLLPPDMNTFYNRDNISRGKAMVNRVKQKSRDKFEEEES